MRQSVCGILALMGFLAALVTTTASTPSTTTTAATTTPTPLSKVKRGLIQHGGNATSFQQVTRSRGSVKLSTNDHQGSAKSQSPHTVSTETPVHPRTLPPSTSHLHDILRYEVNPKIPHYHVLPQTELVKISHSAPIISAQDQTEHHNLPPNDHIKKTIHFLPQSLHTPKTYEPVKNENIFLLKSSPKFPSAEIHFETIPEQKTGLKIHVPELDENNLHTYENSYTGVKPNQGKVETLSVVYSPQNIEPTKNNFKEVYSSEDLQSVEGKKNVGNINVLVHETYKPIYQPEIKTVPIYQPDVKSVPIYQPEIKSVPIYHQEVKTVPIYQPEIKTIPQNKFQETIKQNQLKESLEQKLPLVYVVKKPILQVYGSQDKSSVKGLETEAKLNPKESDYLSYFLRTPLIRVAPIPPPPFPLHSVPFPPHGMSSGNQRFHLHNRPIVSGQPVYKYVPIPMLPQVKHRFPVFQPYSLSHVPLKLPEKAFQVGNQKPVKEITQSHGEVLPVSIVNQSIKIGNHNDATRDKIYSKQEKATIKTTSDVQEIPQKIVYQTYDTKFTFLPGDAVALKEPQKEPITVDKVLKHQPYETSVIFAHLEGADGWKPIVSGTRISDRVSEGHDEEQFEVFEASSSSTSLVNADQES